MGEIAGWHRSSLHVASLPGAPSRAPLREKWDFSRILEIRVNPWHRSFLTADPTSPCAALRSAGRAKAPVPTRGIAHSHPVVIRAAAAFRRHPGDDLVRVGDVAGFAVDAVGRVQADALAVRLGRVFDHFIDVRGTEILAGAAEFFHAFRVADVGVVDDQVRRLVFFMLRAGVVEVGEFVEREFAVALGGAQHMRFRRRRRQADRPVCACARTRPSPDIGCAGRVRR